MPWHQRVARLLALAAVMALSVVMEVYRLQRNGYANTFYSAGVKSMLHSGHAFFFLYSDPGGLISIDKPPLGVWLQVASAKVFGFGPLSLLAPEALVAVLTVLVLYLVLARRFGAWAGVAGALALAVFPSFVAVTRDNNPDALLILLMLLACGAALRGAEAGRLRWLLAAAVLVGLAFNTKTLAAVLVVPGMALGYLVCAPGSVLRRSAQLLGAGVLAGVVSFSWIVVVDLTPAHSRPYVGSSTDNSEIGLTFNYNGLGRVGGQVGGPGRVPNVLVGSGRRGTAGSATSPLSRLRRRLATPASTPGGGVQRSVTSASTPDGRAHHPVAFAGPVGPLRLLDSDLGGQGGWLLPFALVGLLAVAVTRPGRRDPRLAGLLVLGGWFVTEGVVLSLSQGIVHPYYVSALGPGEAAMVGAGAAGMVALARRGGWRPVLVALALAGTVAAQIVLLTREDFLAGYSPILAGAAAVAFAVLVVRRRWAAPALAAGLAALMVAPTVYAATVWQVPVQGTFPAAGPHQAAGHGGVGVVAASRDANLALINYVRRHGTGQRWGLLTVSSVTAAPLTLLGLRAASMAGYGGTDPAVDGPGLGRWVADGQARYVLLGGAYASRGGNAASRAVATDCRMIPRASWRYPATATATATAPRPARPGGAGPSPAHAAGAGAGRPPRARRSSRSGIPPALGPLGAPNAFPAVRPKVVTVLTLYDCAGRVAQLEAAPRV